MRNEKVKVFFNKASGVDPVSGDLLFSGENFEVISAPSDRHLRTADQEITPEKGTVYQVTRQEEGQPDVSALAVYTGKGSFLVEDLGKLQKTLQDSKTHNEIYRATGTGYPINPGDFKPFIG